MVSWGLSDAACVLQYLKQAASHGKDPPDHLQGLTGVRQEGQPAEGKGHQHSCSNSHQQEKPRRTGSHSQAGARQKWTGYVATTKRETTVDKTGPVFGKPSKPTEIFNSNNMEFTDLSCRKIVSPLILIYRILIFTKNTHKKTFLSVKPFKFHV